MATNDNEIVLVDLSSIAYPIWHQSQSDPDANKTSQQTVARVRALATGHPHAAVCCDSGKSFRKDIAPSYKATRPEHDASLQHQIDLAKEQLASDGFPIWSVRGFEADDLIASATTQALVTPDLTVLIVTGDKDLLQLVGPRVRAMSARDGSILDADGVKAKFSVTPGQMRDYLMLVGDASDNVKGANGIGPKKAVDLLTRYGSLENVYKELAIHGTTFTPSLATSLQDFRQRKDETCQLITLRTDVDLPFAEIANERVPKDVESFGDFAIEPEEPMDETPTPSEAPVQTTSDPSAPPADTAGPTLVQPSTALAVRQPDEILPAPKEWERQLDPRSMKDARILAKDMYDSRMFSAYGTPQGVLATVMVGRELGLPAMASLRCIYNIEGKHSLSASLMVALVLKSGLAEYFEPVSFTDKEATFETHRKGARNPVKLTHTFDMALQAWPKSKKDWQDAFNASGWGRNPTDMLVARATSRLARMVFPDLLAGLYTPEELIEVREALAA